MNENNNGNGFNIGNGNPSPNGFNIGNQVPPNNQLPIVENRGGSNKIGLLIVVLILLVGAALAVFKFDVFGLREEEEIDFSDRTREGEEPVVVPSNPTDPSTPTNPTNPTDPTNPTESTTPTNPTEPTNPADAPTPVTNLNDPTQDPEYLEFKKYQKGSNSNTDKIISILESKLPARNRINMRDSSGGEMFIDFTYKFFYNDKTKTLSLFTFVCEPNEDAISNTSCSGDGTLYLSTNSKKVISSGLTPSSASSYDISSMLASKGKLIDFINDKGLI